MEPRLIVALDTGDRHRALELIEILLPAVGLFKIGLELYCAHGPSIVREAAAAGASVFLDLKLHDIPNTVAGAVHSSLSLPGVRLLTLHTAGGKAMLEAGVKAAEDLHARGNPAVPRPGLIGVTVLTSLDDEDLRQVGVPTVVPEQVQRLARLARECGLDGLVCSPREVHALREEFGTEFTLITPGIRPKGSGQQDQKRSATPEQALRDGASHLVVGRPITTAPAPLDAARRIIETLP